MPKQVDSAERREIIADAVFALVAERGVEGASLRNVAQRSGLNIGSVRHSVDGAEGMLVDAVRVMSERVERRLRARVQDAARESQADIDVALDLLEEFLPLDDARRLEVTIWLAFTEYARTHPQFREDLTSLLEGPRQVAGLILQRAGVVDARLGAELVAAAVDGLTIALVHTPDRLTRAEVRRLLAAQLEAAIRVGNAPVLDSEPN